MPTGIYSRENYLKSESRFRPRGENCHSYRHGMTNTKFHRAYQSLKTRCNNKNFKDHKIYFDKGIKCEWESFENFKKDMYKSYLKHVEKHGEKQTTLDRVDGNGNYCKENCRWATLYTQSNNRSNNIQVTINGETKNIAEWARAYGLKKETIYDRIKKLRWDKVRAVITPKIEQ
jgi:hypothetical protein